MNQTNPTPVKQCEFCEKVLHGRSDQRFCNDSCRNTFNRNLRMAEKAEHHKNIPEIIRIIKRNYEILKPMTKTITYVDEYKYYDNLEEFLKTGIILTFSPVPLLTNMAPLGTVFLIVVFALQIMEPWLDFFPIRQIYR